MKVHTTSSLIAALVWVAPPSGTTALDAHRNAFRYVQEKRLRGLKTGGGGENGNGAPQKKYPTNGGGTMGKVSKGTAAPASPSKGEKGSSSTKSSKGGGSKNGMNGFVPSKGKGSTGPGGDNGVGTSCERLAIQFRQEDVEDHYTEDRIGGGMVMSGING